MPVTAAKGTAEKDTTAKDVPGKDSGARVVDTARQDDLLAKARDSQLGNYKPPAFVLTRGSGPHVWDAAGRRYLDFSGGIAVTSVGHANSRLARAIADQANTLVHTSNLFYNERAIQLAHALTKRTGFAKAFFCNSGAEANEAMIKLSRRWHHDHGAPERKKIIAMNSSFHGRTMGALAVTGQPKYHVGMEPMMGGVVHVPFNDVAALESAVDAQTAAIIVEPIQAEGGIAVPADDYLRRVRALADARGVLLLLDEVQTGVGRTGTFLAADKYGVRADACSLAKGIAGGVPLGVMLVDKSREDGLPPGSHATTFGGNPIACRAALEVLSILDDDDVLGNVARASSLARARMETWVGRFKVISEIRGFGLLLGARVAAGVDALALNGKMRDEGLLLSIAGGDVLRISPSLNIGASDLQAGLDTMERVLAVASQ